MLYIFTTNYLFFIKIFFSIIPTTNYVLSIIVFLLFFNYLISFKSV